MRPKSLEERFWVKVAKTPACWNWTAFVDSKGYGRINVEGKSKLAHRISLQLSGISLIDGLFADHICRNRRCVNPGHLRQVSPMVNSLENSNSLQAKNAARTHCIRGHEFAGDNLYRSRFGRACRTCVAMRHKRRKKS